VSAGQQVTRGICATTCVRSLLTSLDSSSLAGQARCLKSPFFVTAITLAVLEFRRAGASAMRTPYGLSILDNCVTCPVRQEHLFCNLPPLAVQKLNEIKSTAVYPKSAMLFIEGQLPRGVFVLCTGKAKLSTSSSGGKTIITKISEPGDVLGLNATISNHPYEVTAEMIEPGQANFITRDALLQFLKEHGEVALRVAEQLSLNYYAAYEEIRTLGLASSPAEKFAKLLLSWESGKEQENGPVQIRLTLTHEEIAEMIGTTRETVSRLFSTFRKKQLLQVKGSTLIICNKPALEKMGHP
jgi:CRP/FNR family cyclic AMP-dependent transcriptional regulator